MSKRSVSPTENIIQPIKRQRNSEDTERIITSNSSEKTLQLLYKGANKLNNNNDSQLLVNWKCNECSFALNKSKCNYCNKCICSSCGLKCSVCTEEYCVNCCCLTYDDREQVCYSCY